MPGTVRRFQGLRGGKHVICTKPLVNSMDDARRVWQAYNAARGRCKLLVGQSTPFFDRFGGSGRL
jgi:predicted dehydrogenase